MEEKDKQLADEISKQVVDGIKKELPKMPIGGKVGGKLSFGLIKDIVIIVLIVVAIIFGFKFTKDVKKNFTVDQVEGHDVTVENKGIFGHTVGDFEDVIVGKATQEALFIVDEQELSVNSTLKQTGMFNWGIFEKNQAVFYSGKAQYTVDLSKLSSSDIAVDDEKHTITITIPSVELHEVIFDPDKTVMGATDNGLLGFGDVKLNAEQTAQIESSAKKELREKAEQSVCFDKAKEFAKYTLRDLFETTISSVDDSYKVKIQFN